MKQNDPSRGKVSRPDDDARSAAALLPIMAVVFIAYLVIGLAMPVLPIYVHLDLGLSTFVVGLVSGSQFVASFFSRVWAGHHADTRGHRHAVVTGLLIAATSFASVRGASSRHLDRHRHARPRRARRRGKPDCHGRS